MAAEGISSTRTDTVFPIAAMAALAGRAMRAGDPNIGIQASGLWHGDWAGGFNDNYVRVRDRSSQAAGQLIARADFGQPAAQLSASPVARRVTNAFIAKAGSLADLQAKTPASRLWQHAEPAEEGYSPIETDFWREATYKEGAPTSCRLYPDARSLARFAGALLDTFGTHAASDEILRPDLLSGTQVKINYNTKRPLGFIGDGTIWHSQVEPNRGNAKVEFGLTFGCPPDDTNRKHTWMEAQLRTSHIPDFEDDPAKSPDIHATEYTVGHDQRTGLYCFRQAFVNTEPQPNASIHPLDGFSDLLRLASVAIGGPNPIKTDTF